MERALNIADAAVLVATVVLVVLIGLIGLLLLAYFVGRLVTVFFDELYVETDEVPAWDSEDFETTEVDD